MTLPTHDQVLELKNVQKRYGEVIAVKGISLGIGESEFVTLLGPSGSGKTTILLMIAGFEYPTAGEIILQGKSIGYLPPEKRNVGMVFQNYALFPHMNVYDNVAFSLRMRKFKKDAIQEKVLNVLELVQLRGYEKRKTRELSGGQQQRIAMARALVFDPPILLMDEPLGALDKKLREHMQLELKRIHERLKCTIIYVTHDQEEALVMSDRIAVVNQGRIEQVGSPDELYEKPVNKFVAQFIGESNLIEGKVVGHRDTFLLIELADGSRHQIRFDEKIVNGEEVRFCIRPERIVIGSEAAVDQDALGGIITETIYVGETLRYRVKIGQDYSINVREKNVGKSDRRKEGERVSIRWEKGSLRRL